MKQLIPIILVLLTSIVTQAANKAIDAKASRLTWKGEKVTGKHTGEIKIKSGSIDIGKQTGEILVDMTTISVGDLEGKWKQKLTDHLNSDDFFSTAKNKTSKLKISGIKQSGTDTYKVTGDLTIKKATHPISFDVKKTGKRYLGEVSFDRTKYDIKYNSGNFFENLGDKMVYDIVVLGFDIALK